MNSFPILSKNKSKFIKSLQQKKGRDQEGVFLVEGVKVVGELLSTDWRVDCLIFSERVSMEIPENIPVFIAEKEQFKQISTLVTPNQVLAVVRKKKEMPTEISESGITLILDRINDPGNLGTIIRLADWFGVKNIICSSGSVEIYNPKVIQASMGSVFNIPVGYGDPISLLSGVKERIVSYGAHMEGEELYKIDFPSTAVLVMGSESHGLDMEIQKNVDHLITIPRFGKAESLNVAVASSVILGEMSRQHAG